MCCARGKTHIIIIKCQSYERYNADGDFESELNKSR